MKKTYLVLVLTLASFVTAFSQFLPQGAIIGSGSFSFSSTKIKDTEIKTSYFSISPSAAYLVADDLAVGVGLGIGSETVKNSDTDFKQTSSTTTFGPFVRYYIADGLFGQGGINFGSSKSKSESGGSEFESKDSLFGWNLGLGYAVRVTDTVLFEPMLAYGSVKSKDSDSDVESTESGLLLSAGFTIIFGGN